MEGETPFDISWSSCSVGDAIEVRWNASNRDKKAKFALDRIFAPHSAQQDIFADVSELITSAMDGYDVNLFCYGATGAGKTYADDGSGDNWEGEVLWSV